MRREEKNITFKISSTRKERNLSHSLKIGPSPLQHFHIGHPLIFSFTFPPPPPPSPTFMTFSHTDMCGEREKEGKERLTSSMYYTDVEFL